MAFAFFVIMVVLSTLWHGVFSSVSSSNTDEDEFSFGEEMNKTDSRALAPIEILKELSAQLALNLTDGMTENWSFNFEWNVPDAVREKVQISGKISFAHQNQEELSPMLLDIKIEFDLIFGASYYTPPKHLQLGFKSSGSRMWLILPRRMNAEQPIMDAFELPDEGFKAMDQVFRTFKRGPTARPANATQNDLQYGTPFDRLRFANYSKVLLCIV